MFRLDEKFAREMIAHAQREAPNECCGLLAGAKGRVEAVFPAKNALSSPVRYSLDPKELYRLLKTIDEGGWDLLGIYHSHTHSQAYPSATDRELAFWPDCLYIIVSLQDPRRPGLRAFYLREGRVQEEELTLAAGAEEK